MKKGRLLALAWGATLLGGTLVGGERRDKARRLPAPAAMLASALLTAAAALAARGRRHRPAPEVSQLTALGMAGGFLGDLALAGWLGPISSTLSGMLFFGAGHLCYIEALRRFSQHHRLADRAAWGRALLGWSLVGAAGWYLVVWRGSRPTLLHRAALPYSLLLSTTAAVASAVAMQERRARPVAAGAALFLLSDLILAGRLFDRFHFPHIGDAIWWLYSPGQALIVFGIAALDGDDGPA